MIERIKIGFLGSMNAMPMTYALKFFEDGFDVKYVVEAKKNNLLMRPEHQFPRKLSYPYPSWIREIPWENNLLKYGLLPYSNPEAIKAMADRNVIFLNDYGIALARHLPKDAIKIALSSGGDIDQTCNWEVIQTQAKSALPRKLRPIWWALALRRALMQREGLKHCRAISYFPKGLNPDGDAIIDKIVNPSAQILIPRYDVNFEAAGTSMLPQHDRHLSEILVAVRFKIITPKGTEIEYKGNDIILRALAEYRKRNSRVKIHLIRKGELSDLKVAEQLCKDLNLDSNVVWHEPMPLPDLFRLYQKSDVCIDQVGTHWMGAIGCYALHMGRPLIANARLEVMEPFWGEGSPILNAKNEAQIIDHLIRCEDPVSRAEIGLAGHVFAQKHLDVSVTYEKLKRFLFDEIGIEQKP